jgi:hypothetical protein
MLSNSGIHSRQLAFIGAVAASTRIGGYRRLGNGGTASGELWPLEATTPRRLPTWLCDLRSRQGRPAKAKGFVVPQHLRRRLNLS